MGDASLSPNNSFGFNPEHSTVVTPTYRETFGDRWLNNGFAVTGGGGTGATLLERSHFYATVGCGRNEDTFDGSMNNPGEGAFIVNISGPVRAIRSYLGANSYLYTANTHFFYPGREDLVTDVRGHAGLPGYGSADDYVTGTVGLKYSDPENTGVPIDGTADTVTPIAYTTGRDRAADVADGRRQPGLGRDGAHARHRHLGPRRHDRVPGPQRGVTAAVHRRRGGVRPERHEPHVAREQRAGHRPDAVDDARPRSPPAGSATSRARTSRPPTRRRSTSRPARRSSPAVTG